MALIPLLFEDPFEFSRPSRILGQRFGLGLSDEDLLAPFTIPREFSSLLQSPAGYIRPWKSQSAEDDVGSTVKFEKDKFQASLDVQQFAPNEISVKVTGDNEITIEGKHEEKKDEHGFVSRQFVRKYVLPRDCDLSKVESQLSSDGVLTLVAPRGNKQIQQKEIPISQTGKPSKAIEDKKKGDEKKK